MHSLQVVADSVGMHKDGFQYFLKPRRKFKLDLDFPVPWIGLSSLEAAESNRLRVSTTTYTPTWVLALEAHSLSAIFTT